MTTLKSIFVDGYRLPDTFSLLSLKVNFTSELEIFGRKICESTSGIFSGLRKNSKIHLKCS